MEIYHLLVGPRDRASMPWIPVRHGGFIRGDVLLPWFPCKTTFGNFLTRVVFKLSIRWKLIIKKMIPCDFTREEWRLRYKQIFLIQIFFSARNLNYYWYCCPIRLLLFVNKTRHDKLCSTDIKELCVTRLLHATDSSLDIIQNLGTYSLSTRPDMAPIFNWWRNGRFINV